jgi:hypothetical protein
MRPPGEAAGSERSGTTVGRGALLSADRQRLFDIHNNGAYTATVSKRINVVLPDETGALPDRVAVKGARSRFIDYAVRHVVERHGRRGSNATNGCSQIVIQGAQDTELPPLNPDYPWQPPLAVAITGTGFGFLPFPGTQPYVGLASALMNTAGTQSVLTISDNGGSTNGTSAWTTEPGQRDTRSTCQVYVAEWNDSNIWLFLNLPVNVQDGYLDVMSFAPTTYLSPLSDVTWWPFQAMAPSPSPTGCPVGYTSTSQFDQLTFQIYNPETGTSASILVNVSPTGTGLN